MQNEVREIGNEVDAGPLRTCTANPRDVLGRFMFGERKPFPQVAPIDVAETETDEPRIAHVGEDLRIDGLVDVNLRNRLATFDREDAPRMMTRIPLENVARLFEKHVPDGELRKIVAA